MPRVVLVDANVFFAPRLRDLFMFLHAAELIHLHWSAEIDHKWVRNVVENHGAEPPRDPRRLQGTDSNFFNTSTAPPLGTIPLLPSHRRLDRSTAQPVGKQVSTTACKTHSTRAAHTKLPPMTRLDAADQLAALMRVQIASLRQAANAKTSAKAGAKPNSPAKSPPATASTKTSADIAALAAERIRGIAPDDPDRKRKALRAFLECVLREELGAALVSDPAFGRMMDHVQRQFESDPALASAAAQAADALLEAARR
ncbi:MAG TPA: hypothetical protein VHA82_20045 [Ramlibacter sp.]|nr:hypothetical protein [Ramlibacter sp.]